METKHNTESVIHRKLEIEEFELTKPDDYEGVVQNADTLFAELLVRYYNKKELDKRSLQLYK